MNADYANRLSCHSKTKSWLTKYAGTPGVKDDRRPSSTGKGRRESIITACGSAQTAARGGMNEKKEQEETPLDSEKPPVWG